VVDHPSKLTWRADDVVLLAVKTQDVEACVRELPPHVITICLTNGLEAERIAARYLDRVHGGCVFMPAGHLTPGVVQVWSWPLAGAIDIGRYPHGLPEVELVAEGLASEGMADIMEMKRGKLLSNLANGAEALAGPAARQSDIAHRAREEARACFAAAKLSLPDPDTEARRRAGIESRPIAGAARAGGSTWQSLARGRTLEVDYLNGEIALLGRLHGIPTPVNTGLQRLANAAARASARPGALTLEELEARLRG
jgi:2-dehydropantoate 2-reductase